MKYIWNNSYFVLRYEVKVKCDHRSKFSNLSNWKEEAWKTSGLQRDSNPWPPRIPVRCSTNWAMKPHIGRKVNLLTYFVLRYEVKVKCDHRSKFSNLSNWKEEAWKKSGLQRDSNPWPPRIPVRCSTNWAMKPHIGSKVNLLSSSLPVQWNHVKYIWNNSYFVLRYEVKVKCDHRSKFSNLSNWKEEAWKKSGLQRDSNRWSPDVFFRLLLSNCLNWKIYCDDHTSLSPHTAVQNMNYFIYISHDFTAREEMNSINWPCSQCVAS